MRNEKLRKTISALRQLLKNEERLLDARKYDALAGIHGRKEQLTAELEGTICELMIDDRSSSLKEALESLSAKAKENAAQLAIVRQGFADARDRIRAIAERDKKTGLYSAGGRKMRQPISAAGGRSV